MVMKTFINQLSVLCVVIIVVLVILLGLRSIDGSGTAPSYRFLAGRYPTVYKDVKTQGLDTFYAYSFEADFNDVCLKADVELIGAGFVVRTNIGKTLSGNEYSIRNYMQKNRFPRGPVFIYIYNNRQYSELPNPEKDALYMKDGWVTVEVVYFRGWQWPF